jgi:hypothetical protein
MNTKNNHAEDILLTKYNYSNIKIVSDILNETLNNQFLPNPIGSCIALGLSLGQFNINYTYPAFLYLTNLINSLTPEQLITTNDYKKTLEQLHFRMKENFLDCHLDKKTLLPLTFIPILEYFSANIFNHKIENTYSKKELAHEHQYVTFIRSALYQQPIMFDYMIKKIEENNIVFNEKQTFFKLIRDLGSDLQSIVKNPLSSIKNMQAIEGHSYTYFKENTKPDTINFINDNKVVFQPDFLKQALKLFQLIIEPNMDHVKKNLLYIRNKKSDAHNDLLDTLLIVKPLAPVDLYMEWLNIFQSNFVKMLTLGKQLNNNGTKGNYLAFSSICANSTVDFNSNKITNTGKWWLSNNWTKPEDYIKVTSQYEDFDTCNLYLKKIYQDFIISPHRDDLRIVLFSHLDKKCIETGLNYFKNNENDIVNFFSTFNDFNKELLLKNHSVIAPLSHLFMALYENPIVVFHALKLQGIHEVLSTKTTKKYSCTNEEYIKIETDSNQLIKNLSLFFEKIKTHLPETALGVVFHNEPANPSYSNNPEQSFIPKENVDTKLLLNPLTINEMSSNYKYYLLQNLLNNKDTNIAKKIMKI